MPIYHRLGQVPAKRHTQFEKPDGNLYYEQLFGTIGFDGMSSLLYHIQRPTMVKEILGQTDVTPKIVVEKNLTSRKLVGFDVAPQKDFLQSRSTLLVNNDVHIGVAAPKESMTQYFYKNADADEMLFIHIGTGTLKTLLGQIRFEYGDYLIIPRGMIYQIEFDSSDNRILYAESFHPIYTPKRYRNWFGQLLEHSPYCERDYKLPEDLETHDETGEFLIKVKKQNTIHEMVYASHPFDVIGWDGYNYPYGFSIHNFEPAIPAPYNHSNIDSDEMLYYVDGDFMSRTNIGPGHISLHPSGIPHGPHPGTYEASIGQTETAELAVMIDTFKPLMITENALKIDDGKYYKSWMAR